jgi:hypothetical protein
MRRAQPSRELLCIDCGYNLGGLRGDGVCPECGTALAKSVRGDRLDVANESWLAQVTRGQRFLWVGFSGLTLVLLTLILVPFAVSAAQMAILFTCVGIAFIGFLLVLVCGSILLTAQEPRTILSESHWSYRNRARVSLMAAIATTGAILANDWIIGIALPKPVVSVAAIVCVAAVSVSIVSIMRVLQSLAIRACHRRLAERTRKTGDSFRWIPIAAALILLLPSGSITAVSTPVSGALALAGCFANLLALALVVQMMLLPPLMRAHLRLMTMCLRRAIDRSATVSRPAPPPS